MYLTYNIKISIILFLIAQISLLGAGKLLCFPLWIGLLPTEIIGTYLLLAGLVYLIFLGIDQK